MLSYQLSSIHLNQWKWNEKFLMNKRLMLRQKIIIRCQLSIVN